MSFNIEEIKEQVKRVIQYSQNMEEIKVDALIDSWLEAKRDFIETFEGNLIWESPEPVSFPLDKCEKTSRVNDFSDEVYKTYHNYSLCRFIDRNTESFYDNEVGEDYEIEGKKIPKGMKLVKAFKYFESDANTLDKIQMAASRIIQENKVTGTLCFSVHPLDFLSSSENTYSWRSCHALDGEYRAGNLSYMLDRATVVCYLKGADNQKLPHFPDDVLWNSKKWRVLLFVSDNWDMLSLGRQYPFAMAAGAEKITDIFLKILKKNTWYFSTLTDSQITDPSLFSPYIKIGDHLFPLADIVIDPENPLHYNDLLRSHCYTMQYTADVRRRLTGSFPKIHVGSPVKCLCCEKQDIYNSESMLCFDCDQKYGTDENDTFAVCDCCGNRFYREDGYFVLLPNGEEDYVCPDCSNDACTCCESCGELFYSNDLVYDSVTDEYICPDCYFSRQEERDSERRFNEEEE